jgi:hypothetical protein
MDLAVLDTILPLTNNWVAIKGEENEHWFSFVSIVIFVKLDSYQARKKKLQHLMEEHIFGIFIFYKGATEKVHKFLKTDSQS